MLFVENFIHVNISDPSFSEFLSESVLSEMFFFFFNDL